MTGVAKLTSKYAKLSHSIPKSWNLQNEVDLDGYNIILNNNKVSRNIELFPSTWEETIKKILHIEYTPQVAVVGAKVR